MKNWFSRPFGRRKKGRSPKGRPWTFGSTADAPAVTLLALFRDRKPGPPSKAQQKRQNVTALIIAAAALLFAAYSIVSTVLYNQQRAIVMAIRATSIGFPINEFDFATTPAANRRAAHLKTLRETTQLLNWVRLEARGSVARNIVVGSCPWWGHGDAVSSSVVEWCSGRRAGVSPDLQDAASLYVLLHEIGHVTIRDRHLALLGPEEDSADEFATLVALNTNHPEIALGGAQFFIGLHQHPVSDDVHSAGIERAGRIACLLYGSNPDRYAAFAASAHVQRQWRSGCVSIYNVAARSWDMAIHTSAFRLSAPGREPVQRDMLLRNEGP